MRLAIGDINGDGKDNLITAPGQGGGPEVNIYFGTAGGSFIAGGGQVMPAPSLAFYALGPTLAGYAGGIYVDALDVNGDGKADLFCGAGSGSCEVTVFSGAQLSGPSPNFSPRTAFFAPSYFGDNSTSFATVPTFTDGAIVGLSPILTAEQMLRRPTFSVSPVPPNTVGAQGTTYDVLAIFNNPGVQPNPDGIPDFNSGSGSD